MGSRLSTVNGIISWPEHHQGLAWWIAIILSSPIWIKWAWRGLRTLPVWGAKFQRQQRAVRIRNLEYLHGDTYRLLLYLAGEAIDLAKDLLNTLLTLLGLAWVLHGNLTVSEVVIFTALSFGSSLFGNVLRLLQLVHDLKNYETALAVLKRKQDKPIRGMPAAD